MSWNTNDYERQEELSHAEHVQAAWAEYVSRREEMDEREPEPDQPAGLTAEEVWRLFTRR
jgi:hypothetical protein